MPDHTHIEACLKEARPRVLATLQRQFNQLELSEDALQEAMCKALEKWPESGFPDNPTAWLITVSRHAAIDIIRRTQKEWSLDQTEFLSDEHVSDQTMKSEPMCLDNAGYRDDILRLLFCCCHPELKPQDQMALALKIICGLSVASIAKMFLSQQKAMEKRITRAKQKAQNLTDGLTLPAGEQRNRRIHSVSNLIYLLFNEGYSKTGGDEHISAPMCAEAIRLARLLLDLFPGEAEVMGLLSLCLLNHARSTARLDETGNLVPLEQQDRSRWQQELISQGIVYRDKALRLNQTGVFQLQACITAEHCIAQRAEDTRWDIILGFYDQIFVLQPSPIIVLNRAVAVAKEIGIDEALSELEQVKTRLSNFLYFHTTSAGLLMQQGKYLQSKEAYLSALKLNPTAQEEQYILEQLKLIEDRALS